MSGAPPDIAVRDAEVRRTFQGRVLFMLWYLKCPFCDGDILHSDSRGLSLAWKVARCRHGKERLE